MAYVIDDRLDVEICDVLKHTLYLVNTINTYFDRLYCCSLQTRNTRFNIVQPKIYYHYYLINHED